MAPRECVDWCFKCDAVRQARNSYSIKQQSSMEECRNLLNENRISAWPDTESGSHDRFHQAILNSPSIKQQSSMEECRNLLNENRISAWPDTESGSHDRFHQAILKARLAVRNDQEKDLLPTP